MYYIDCPKVGQCKGNSKLDKCFREGIMTARSYRVCMREDQTILIMLLAAEGWWGVTAFESEVLDAVE